MTIQALFVCTGNICRSPFAERYARSLPQNVIEFTSAGTSAVVGAPIDPDMAVQVEDHGGSADDFAARQLDASLIADADVILTLEASHRQWVLDDFPAAVKRTFTLGQAAQSLRDAPPGVEPLVYLGAHRLRPRRRDDVPDPYRRGEVAMQQAAGSIAHLLDLIVPTLAQVSPPEPTPSR